MGPARENAYLTAGLAFWGITVAAQWRDLTSLPQIRLDCVDSLSGQLTSVNILDKGVILYHTKQNSRVSYSGYYECFPSIRGGSDSRYPLHVKTAP